MCHLGSVFSSKLKNYWRCLLLNRTLGKRSVIFCVMKDIMVQVGAISKEAEKRRGIKPLSKERKCDSHVIWFHAILVIYLLMFVSQNGNCLMYRSFIKTPVRT